MHGRRGRLQRRLKGYWRFEALNVLLVPAGAVYFASRCDGSLGACSLVALLAASLLLVAGAIYWRAKLIELLAGGSADPTVRRLAKARAWLLLFTCTAVLAAALSWLGLARSGVDRWVATLAALLAVAEYVNYFHVQLQHFDHWPDLRRLLTGRGFRQAHLARDIAGLEQQVRSGC